LMLKKKLKVDDYLKKVSIQKLSFKQGFFAEFFFEFQNIGFSYWGDADHKICITTMGDIAKVVAEAISQADLAGDIVYVGNELTIGEISQIYNQKRDNKTVPKRLGSLDYLKTIYDLKRKNSADSSVIEPLGLSQILFDKRSRFEKKHNDMFSEIKPTTIEEFLEENPDVTVGLNFPHHKLFKSKSTIY